MEQLGRPETPNGVRQTLEFIYRDLQEVRVDIRDLREEVVRLSAIVHEERGVRIGRSAAVGGIMGFLSGLIANILRKIWD